MCSKKSYFTVTFFRMLMVSITAGYIMFDNLTLDGNKH